MKFNFRKISAVLTSAIMLGSSLGIAAAANYPAPFVVGSTADVAIVYGTGSGVSTLDQVYASNINLNLQSKMGTGGGGVTTTCAGGDCYLFELASTHLNMNDTLRSIRDADIGNSELPNLLKTLDYRSGDGKVYGYNQKIRVSGSATTGLQYGVFHDSDFNGDKPSLGMKIKDGKRVMNYTVSWTKTPESTVDSAGRLDDLENSKIVLLGKEYTILNAYNESVNSAIKLELMGGAVVSSVNSGESVTHTLNGKSYTIRASYISDTKCTLCISIDGGAESCEAELQKGETYTLSDGTNVGVRVISYVAKAGTLDSVDFSLGAEKITLQNASNVEINDVDISGLNVILDRVPITGAKEGLSNIIFEWEADDDLFISGDGETIFPGLGGIKIASKGFYVPAEEVIKVQDDGSKGVEIVIPIKSGTANIPIFYGNESTFTYIGSDTDDILNTGNVSSAVDDTPHILFNRSSGADNKWFVATWNSSTEGGSYFLSASSPRDSSGVNYTTIKDEVSGIEVCKDRKKDDTCVLGNLVITLGNIQRKADTVELTLGAGSSFNRIISKEGMTFYLPIANATGTGASVGGDGSESAIITYGLANLSKATTWVLKGIEEDKDGKLGNGQDVNVTLGWSGSKTRVSQVRALWAGSDSAITTRNTDPNLETDPKADTEKYVEWVKSDLATMVTHNRPSGSDSQYSAEITYHGGESYGIVYLADENADMTQTGTTTTTGTAQLGEISVKDTEVNQVASKNLIIVGGSCINSAAAKALGLTGATCGAAFTEKTGVGSGQFLINSVGDVYATGKIALVVAGYDVADTQNAAKYLTTQVVDTTAGKKYKGTSSTSAELVVEGTA